MKTVKMKYINVVGAFALVCATTALANCLAPMILTKSVLAVGLHKIPHIRIVSKLLMRQPIGVNVIQAQREPMIAKTLLFMS